MKNEFTRELLRLSGTLLIITVIVALCLGAVNAVTKEPIAEINKQRTNDAMKKIVPDAQEFIQQENFTTDDETILEVYDVMKGGAKSGLCVKVAPTGFGGEMNMIVGIDGQGNVLGVRIVKTSETAGLGSRASEPEFIEQYNGKPGPFQVVKNQASAEGDIVAISGATITSRAVNDGVTSALAYAAANS